MIDELTVRKILNELSQTDYQCFSSEAQLRDAFAIALSQNYKNCVVYPEYTQPKPIDWRCNEDLIHFDLLVKDNDSEETILFEFKYKTKKGEFNLNEFTVYLRDQSDTTNGRYAIWRDIYRIETFVNSKAITKGFIIFVTNNSSYYAEPKNNIISEQFSIAEGLHKSGQREWNFPSGQTVSTSSSIHAAYRKDKSPLISNNDYYFHYDLYSRIKDANENEHDFYQLILPIHSSDYNNQIETLLKKAGKQNFIKYYLSFSSKSADDCKKELINNGFSTNSANTITSSAKQLFSQQRNTEALRNIIASSKTEDLLRKEALALL